MKKFLLIYAVLYGTVFGTTYFVTQAGAGSANGSTLGNAWSAANFSTAGNWSATPGTAGKISPGDTVSLNGTFTPGALTTQGPGLNGNKITILFASGAKISGTGWTGNAITGNHGFITVDGGTNGLIENLDNGTSLGHQVDCTGVAVNSATDFTVQNLTISPLYVRTGTSDTNSFGNGVFASGVGNCNNLVVDHNTIRNMVQGIIYAFQTGAVNVQFSRNTISDTNWSMAIGDNGTAGNSLAGVRVWGNNSSNWATWEQSGNLFHHNGLLMFCNNATGSITDIQIYNEIYGPGFGPQNTSAIYTNGGIGDQYIFNCQFLPAADEGPANGMITLRSMYRAQTNHLYNNLFNQPGAGPASCGIWMQIDFAAVAMTVDAQNNIFVGNWFYNIVDIPTGGSIAYNGNHQMFYNTQHFGSPGGQETIAAWMGFGPTFDNDMITTNPQFVGGGNFHLQSSSPARGAASNLTSTGIAALNHDADGVLRPTVAPWDQGPFQFASAPAGGFTTSGKATFAGKVLIQ